MKMYILYTTDGMERGHINDAKDMYGIYRRDHQSGSA